MKKIYCLILMLILVFSVNTDTYANTKMTVEDVVQQILENDKISEDTKEWLIWFNKLSKEEQMPINYRPNELDGYKYEKFMYDGMYTEREYNLFTNFFKVNENVFSHLYTAYEDILFNTEYYPETIIEDTKKETVSYIDGYFPSFEASSFLNNN